MRFFPFLYTPKKNKYDVFNNLLIHVTVNLQNVNKHIKQ